MIPGPTILPPEVRAALSRPSMFHRGAEFAAVLAECEQGLQEILGTEQPVAILTSSGTGAVEAATRGERGRPKGRIFNGDAERRTA